jgi:hypothetical protein
LDQPVRRASAPSTEFPEETAAGETSKNLRFQMIANMSLDARGKRQRKYKQEDYATPYEKWKSLPEAKNYLKEGMSLARLDAMAKTMSDTEWARKMRAARVALLRRCKSESPDVRETT